ncbi:MAG: response regulator [Deltaproteobacteria bacterium]|nr:response regulator [Deltaproteobacteria bacterium]
MRTILVVDDEEDIRLLYKEELEEDGYNVLLASDGQEAVERLVKDKPDLVALDIRMPDMDGIEVLQRIRGMDREIPIVISTAYGDYRQNFDVWAADAFVVKTANLDELKNTIRDLLRHES